MLKTEDFRINASLRSQRFSHTLQTDRRIDQIFMGKFAVGFEKKFKETVPLCSNTLVKAGTVSMIILCDIWMAHFIYGSKAKKKEK